MATITVSFKPGDSASDKVQLKSPNQSVKATVVDLAYDNLGIIRYTMKYDTASDQEKYPTVLREADIEAQTGS